MSTPILELSDLRVAVAGTVVCDGIDLVIQPGESHVLLGPNGSGKSSLLSAIMGVPPFEILSGTARFRGADLTELSITERARAGIGMAFQHPPEVDGVTARRLIRAIGREDGLERQADRLAVTSLLDRDLNVGFSGGELKRWEVLKLGLQAPALCLYDEPESGVDFEHVQVVGRAIRDLHEHPLPDGGRRSALVITHTGFVLDSLGPSIGHLMIDGRIRSTGDAVDMIEQIRRHGYRAV